MRKSQWRQAQGSNNVSTYNICSYLTDGYRKSKTRESIRYDVMSTDSKLLVPTAEFHVILQQFWTSVYKEVRNFRVQFILRSYKLPFTLCCSSITLQQGQCVVQVSFISSHLQRLWHWDLSTAIQTSVIVSSFEWFIYINLISHRIAGVLDFIHHPDFNSYKKKEQTRRFGSWICFRPQVRRDTYSVGSLRKS
jgi:hypothetical protein